MVNCLAERIAHTSSNNRYPAGFMDTARRHFPINIDTFQSNNEEDYNTPFLLPELEDAIRSAGKHIRQVSIKFRITARQPIAGRLDTSSPPANRRPAAQDSGA